MGRRTQGAKTGEEGRNDNTNTRKDEIKRTAGEGKESTISGGIKVTPSIGLSEKVVVESPKPIIIDLPDSVEETKTPSKRTPKVRTKKETGISQTEISSLITGCFSLISLKAGEHWIVTEEESLQVAKPLESILKKLDLLEKVTNASDGAMLIFAVASITLPRVLITKAIMQENKKSVIEQLKGGGQVGTAITTEEKQTGSDTEISGSDSERIKETQSLNSKHDDPLYSTNAQ